MAIQSCATLAGKPRQLLPPAGARLPPDAGIARAFRRFSANRCRSPAHTMPGMVDAKQMAR
jgi:hypothetical protein